MARHSAFGEPEGLAAGTGGDGVPIPGTGEHLLIRALLGRGDIEAALERARRAQPMASRSDAVDLVVDLALEAERLQLARGILAHVGAEISPLQDAHVRARIALCEGDLAAATAILVTAIEAQPGAMPLRALLAEVMVAAGNAADVRAVLSMLGMAPVNPLPRDGSDAAEDLGGVDQRLG
jgi:hypothetical protein